VEKNSFQVIIELSSFLFQHREHLLQVPDIDQQRSVKCIRPSVM